MYKCTNMETIIMTKYKRSDENEQIMSYPYNGILNM